LPLVLAPPLDSHQSYQRQAHTARTPSGHVARPASPPPVARGEHPPGRRRSSSSPARAVLLLAPPSTAMASTAADSRSHVRISSIAQKRSNAASPRTPRTAPRSTGGSSTPFSTPGPDSPASATHRSSTPDIPPRLAIRVIAAALALFLVLHYAPSFLSSSTSTSASSARLSPSALAQHARERKALRQGAPESWVLPRKWRDVRAGEGDVVHNGETLPACKRVMLFRMGDRHGFSSEMLHYARALVVANKLGYALLADDAQVRPLSPRPAPLFFLVAPLADSALHARSGTTAP